MKLRWAMVAVIAAATLASACSDDESDDPTPVCPDGQILCGDECADLDADRLNCGSCATMCGAGEVCSDGVCTANCGAGLTDCSGGCRDLQRDEDNCGGCGAICETGESCVDGACTLVCPEGQTACSGACVDTDADRSNCGACGTTCAVDEVCASGSCAFSCPPGFTDCSGSCRDTTTDRNNCGACGNACGPDERCIGSVCTLSCEGGAPDECNGACTNTQIDPANCGACGVICDASERCDMGSCSVSCSPGLTACGQTCTSTLTDPNNCGACGTACTAAIPGAASVCVEGGCSAACLSGFDDCNDDLVLPGGDGCETDLLGDVNNCGACGDPCEIDNGAGACSVGQCLVAACDTGFDDCNGTVNDGCEADLTSDNANCGVCGNACTGGDVCADSSCTGAVGDDCSSAITLLPGNNAYSWVAFNSDYLTDAPCVTSGSLTGPDVVFTYTSTINAALTLEMEKPSSQRFAFVVSNANSMCGMAAESDQRQCVSEFTGTTMAGDPFLVSAGDTVYVYFSDTTSGSQALPNPLSLTLTVQPAPCAPGSDGLIGGSVARVPTSISVTTEYYVATDTSTTGYVYVGGTSQLERVPKAGGTVEDVEALAGLTSDNLGYEMLIDGDDIYTLDNTETGTTGRVFRISSDGGVTWNVFDAVTFPTSPAEEFRAATAYNGRVYLLTEEDTSTTDTEVWSFPSGVATSTTARLELTFSEFNCSGLAIDDTYIYAACGAGERVVRVDRVTGAVTLVTIAFDISNVNNSLYGADVDNDGAIDYLYLQTQFEEGYFICNVGQSDQFGGEHFDFGGGSGSYGMGLERPNRLFAFDNGTNDVIIVE